MATYVRMRVAAGEYAMPVGNVVEVAPLGAVTAVPGAPPHVLGVLNVRGRILPVVDLARILALARQEPARQLLVATAGGVTTGFAIDSLRGVAELPEPAAEAESEYLAGATLADGDLIGIIDVPALLLGLERSSPRAEGGS